MAPKAEYRRNREITTEQAFAEHWERFSRYLMTLNFTGYQVEAVHHMVNCFYYLALDIGNPEKMKKYHEENNGP